MAPTARTTALLAALAVLLPAAGCGGGNDELAATEARAMVIELFKQVVVNDKEKILSHVMPEAGLGGNAVAAQDLDTEKGRADIREGQRRFLRLIMRDSGITETTQMDRFASALKVVAQSKQAWATFEIAGSKEEKRLPEKVILRLEKRNDRWLVRDYERKLLDE